MKPLRPVLAALFILLSLSGPGAAHQHIEGLDEGTTRIVDKRTFVRFDSPYHLTDLSRDGRLVAFTWWKPGGDTTYLGVIDLTQDSLRFLGPVSRTQIALFSPDARKLLIRRGRAVDLVDVASGAITRGVAKAAYHGQVRWLGDGRLAYLTPERRLVFQRPGRAPIAAGLSIPDPKGYDSLAASIAVDPDGTRVLYARGCRVYVRYLPTRKDKMLNAWDVWVPERAWSPDGARFVLQQTTPYDHCTQASGPLTHDILFAGNGNRIGHVLGYDASASHGHGITWSTDSRTLILTNQITGSAVAGYKEMWAVDIHTKTRSLVVSKRVINSPLGGPGGWIVFSRYRFADGASMGREEGTVVVGRLDPRPT